MKIWQDGGWDERMEKLQGSSVKLLLHLTHVAIFRNIIPGPGEVAEQPSWSRLNVYRAYRELRGADFIYERDGTYYLNPYFCWKGSDQQYEQACRELSTGKEGLRLEAVNG